jgi:hypothetical protein
MCFNAAAFILRSELIILYAPANHDEFFDDFLYFRPEALCYPVPILTTYLPEINLNVILLTPSQSSKWMFSTSFSD